MSLETSNKSHRQPFGPSHDCSWAYTKEYDKISSYVFCMCHVHTAQVYRVDILDLAKPMNCHKWWPSHACQHGILSSDSPVERHFPGTCFHLLDPFQLVKERNYTNSTTFTLIWTMKIKAQQMTFRQAWQKYNIYWLTFCCIVHNIFRAIKLIYKCVLYIIYK
jgi:hypothetical protein